MQKIGAFIVIVFFSVALSFRPAVAKTTTSWCPSGNTACPTAADVLNSFSGTITQKPPYNKCKSILDGLPDISKLYKAMIKTLMAKGETHTQAEQDALNKYGPGAARAMQHYNDCNRNLKDYKLN